MAARNSRSFGLDRLRLEALWDRLWSNYWFLPGLMTLAAGVMALGIGSISLPAATPEAWRPRAIDARPSPD